MRRIGLLGDTHVGSRYGLSPKYWQIEDGPNEQATEIRCNSAQLKLLEYFKDLMVVQYKDCDTLFFMGDMCDGPNKKEYGRSLSTPELDLQVTNCVNLIEPYIQGRACLSVEGSGYHQSEKLSLDSLVAKELKARGHNVRYARMWNVDIQDTKISANILHSSGGASIYRESVVARELLWIKIAEKHLGRAVRLMVRGHWHWFYHSEYGSRHFVYNPGFKLLFPSTMLTGMWARFVPDIGGCVIEIDGDTIRVDKKLYPGIRLLEDFTEI